MIDEKEYFREQIEGHELSEIYALSTPDYLKLMAFLREKIPAYAKVLDLGCNAGYETIMIKMSGHEVVGVDIGEKFVEKARLKGVDAKVMDMHDLKFPDGTFDCVYANNVLEHAHTPSKVLNEMFRVLKHGGVAVICMPSDHLNPGYVAHENWDPRLHVWKPDHEELTEAVVDAGFSVGNIAEIDAGKRFGLKNEASKDFYLVALCAKS